MTNKELLESVVADILGLVASIEEGYTDFTGKKWGSDIYWGHDTDCGTVHEIHARGLKILEEKLGLGICNDCGGLVIAAMRGPLAMPLCTCFSTIDTKTNEVTKHKGRPVGPYVARSEEEWGHNIGSVVDVEFNAPKTDHPELPNPPASED